MQTVSQYHDWELLVLVHIHKWKLAWPVGWSHCPHACFSLPVYDSCCIGTRCWRLSEKGCPIRYLPSLFLWTRFNGLPGYDLRITALLTTNPEFDLVAPPSYEAINSRPHAKILQIRCRSVTQADFERAYQIFLGQLPQSGTSICASGYFLLTVF